MSRKVLKICDESRKRKFGVVVTSFDDLLSAVERRLLSFDRHLDRVVLDEDDTEVDDDDYFRTLPDNTLLRIRVGRSTSPQVNDRKRICIGEIFSENVDGEVAIGAIAECIYSASDGNEDDDVIEVPVDPSHVLHVSTVEDENIELDKDSSSYEDSENGQTHNADKEELADNNSDDGPNGRVNDTIDDGSSRQENCANGSEDDVVEVVVEPKRFQLIDLTEEEDDECGEAQSSSGCDAEKSTVSEDGLDSSTTESDCRLKTSATNCEYGIFGDGCSSHQRSVNTSRASTVSPANGRDVIASPILRGAVSRNALQTERVEKGGGTVSSQCSPMTLRMFLNNAIAASPISNAASPSASQISNGASTSASQISNIASPSASQISNGASTSASQISNIESISASQISNIASPSASQISNTASPSTSQISNTASPSTSQISNTACPSTSQISNAASTSTSQISNTACPSTSQISNAASPSTSQIFSAASISISQISNIVSTSASQISNTVSPTISQISNAASTSTSQISNAASISASQISIIASNSASSMFLLDTRKSSQTSNSQASATQNSIILIESQLSNSQADESTNTSQTAFSPSYETEYYASPSHIPNSEVDATGSVSQNSIVQTIGAELACQLSKSQAGVEPQLPISQTSEPECASQIFNSQETETESAFQTSNSQATEAGGASHISNSQTSEAGGSSHISNSQTSTAGGSSQISNSQTSEAGGESQISHSQASQAESQIFNSHSSETGGSSQISSSQANETGNASQKSNTQASETGGASQISNSEASEIERTSQISNSEANEAGGESQISNSQSIEAGGASQISNSQPSEAGDESQASNSQPSEAGGASQISNAQASEAGSASKISNSQPSEAGDESQISNSQANEAGGASQISNFQASERMNASQISHSEAIEVERASQIPNSQGSKVVGASDTSKPTTAIAATKSKRCNIFFKTYNDSGKHTFMIYARKSDTIFQLKLRIQVAEGIRAKRQVLLFAGEELRDKRTVAECDLSGTVRLVVTGGGRYYNRAAFEVHVETLAGAQLSFWVRSAHSVGSLRQQLLEQDCIVLSPGFVLHYGGERCHDDRLMVDYNVRPGTMFHIHTDTANQPLREPI